MTLAYCNHCGLDHNIEDVFVRENHESICINCFDEWIHERKLLEEAAAQAAFQELIMKQETERTEWSFEENELPF